MFEDLVAHEPESARLARAAREAAQLAMAAGDRANALRWLDRAHRLVPRDGNITLALAGASLGEDDRRAAALFSSVAAECDLREAWLGLAGARLRLVDYAGAAEALGHALARHSPNEGLAAFADTIARAAGSRGWCGLHGSGVPVVGALQGRIAALRLDGRIVKGTLLPKHWRSALQLAVTVDGHHLLGSPIDVFAISRVSGCVENWAGGIRGWAWHPGDPERHPELTIGGAPGQRVVQMMAVDETVAVVDNGPMSRPRGFNVTREQLLGLTAPLHVRGRDGRELFGSPLDPWLEQRSNTAAAAAAARLYPMTPKRRSLALQRNVATAMLADVDGPKFAVGADNRRRPIDVVIPVHGRTETVLACLESVLASVGGGSRVVVVDDASREPELVQALDRMARERRIKVVRHKQPQGFPTSANAGIAACRGRDVILLNSDTLVPPGWIERLRSAAASAPDIGTVTPFSNDASIMTYPEPGKIGPVPDFKETVRLDRLAMRANGGAVVDLPVGVGFCLYVKRACLNAVGAFRADIFAQGYGEENDFCLRARHLGWRNVGLLGLFVAHHGAQSFGSAGLHLKKRNAAILNRLHPGYSELVKVFVDRDPVFEARRRLDLERWRAVGPRKQEAVIQITHADAGGVERRIETSASQHLAMGKRVVVLRPTVASDGREAVVVGEGPEGRFPNLRYVLPDELPTLLRLLRAAHPRQVEVHHFLDHPPAIHDLLTRLGVCYDIHIHDYAWFCPRISLVGTANHYCGEPDLTGCEACIEDSGRLIKEKISVLALRERSARCFSAARQVVAPSRDAAIRIRRHFPEIRPIVRPHEDDSIIAAPGKASMKNGVCRVCVAGAIGLHKGYDVLLACSRNAAARHLPMEFIVVGNTIDDERLLATGRVFITGTYTRHEAVALIQQQDASLGLLPSISPETWSLTLTELWQAGLQVAAFDFGTPGERIRQTGHGILLPQGLPPPAINNALLAAAGWSRHE